MTDGIIKGTGNSRYLKGPANAAALYPDFEAFRDAWAAGTLPFDFNGINPAGWEVVGDKLGKATLLTDALCTALSLPTTATPTQAMDRLRTLTAAAQGTANGRCQITAGSYVGLGRPTGNGSNSVSLTLPFPATILWIPFYATSSNFYETKEMSSYMVSSTLTTSFITGVGMSSETRNYAAGRKSSDGRTFYWYYTRPNYSSGSQFDDSDKTYYYIAIG